jgi:hypothetical protein
MATAWWVVAPQGSTFGAALRARMRESRRVNSLPRHAWLALRARWADFRYGGVRPW